MAKKKKTTRRRTQPSTSKPRTQKASRANVRKRVHDLTLRAVRENDLSVHDIPNLAHEVVQSAADGLDKSMPRSKNSVLRQVVGGLTDAAAAAAKAATTTAKSAADRGSHFLKSDAKRTAKDLEELEHKLLDSISRAGKSLSSAARLELDAAVHEARHAGTKIRAAASSIRQSSDGRLGELGREAADSGSQAARRALSSILQGAGGFLEGLADAVTKSAPRPKPSRRSGGSSKRSTSS